MISGQPKGQTARYKKIQTLAENYDEGLSAFRNRISGSPCFTDQNGVRKACF
jgi:hypothetical protein